MLDTIKNSSYTPHFLLGTVCAGGAYLATRNVSMLISGAAISLAYLIGLRSNSTSSKVCAIGLAFFAGYKSLAPLLNKVRSYQILAYSAVIFFAHIALHYIPIFYRNRLIAQGEAFIKAGDDALGKKDWQQAHQAYTNASNLYAKNRLFTAKHKMTQFKLLTLNDQLTSCIRAQKNFDEAFTLFNKNKTILSNQHMTSLQFFLGKGCATENPQLAKGLLKQAVTSLDSCSNPKRSITFNTIPTRFTFTEREALTQLGFVHYRLEEWGDAETILKRAVKQLSNHRDKKGCYEASRFFSSSSFKQKKWDEVRQVSIQALNIYQANLAPSNTATKSLLNLLGGALIESGQQAEGKEVLEIFEEIDAMKETKDLKPFIAQVALIVGELILNEDKNSEAEPLLKKAATELEDEEKVKTAQALLWKAFVFQGKENTKEAQALAKHLNPQLRQSYLLARAKSFVAKQGETPEAAAQ